MLKCLQCAHPGEKPCKDKKMCSLEAITYVLEEHFLVEIFVPGFEGCVGVCKVDAEGDILGRKK